MLRNWFTATVLFVLFATTAQAQPWAQKMFKTTSHEFGTVAKGAKTEFAFNLQNLYEEDVQGCGRYRLLETVRQYGSDRLIDAGDGERTRDEHLRFYLDLAEQAESQIRMAEQVQWLDMLETEHDNLRAALAWSVQREPQAGVGGVPAHGPATAQGVRGHGFLKTGLPR